jgi:superfamily I DNA and/or RNA helicase
MSEDNKSKISNKLLLYQSILNRNIKKSEHFDLKLLNYATLYSYNLEKDEFEIDINKENKIFYNKITKLGNEESIAVTIRYNIDGRYYPILIAYLSDNDVIGDKIVFDSKQLKIYSPSMEILGYEYEEVNEKNLVIFQMSIKEKIEFITQDLKERYENVEILRGQFLCGVVNITSFDTIIKEKIDYYIKNESKIRESDIMYKYLAEEKVTKTESKISITPIQTNLDKDQKKAVEIILDNKLQALNGPPGTGKSQTITEILLQSILLDKKVLLTSYNNKPVEVVYRKIQKILGVDIPFPCYCGNIQQNFKDYAVYIRNLKTITNKKKLKEQFNKLDKELQNSKEDDVSQLLKDIIINKINLSLIEVYDRDIEVLEDSSINANRIYQAKSVLEGIIDESNIVFSTILKGINNLSSVKNYFDLILVDEASQCNQIAVVPLLYNTRSIAVIGDPKQLSHIPGNGYNILELKSEMKKLKLNFELNYIDNTLFDYVNDLRVKNQYSELFLSFHYRSGVDIINFSNINYYDSRLKVYKEEKGRLNWYDIVGQSNKNNYNDLEVQAVVTRVLHYMKTFEIGQIGIISQYRNQVYRIRKVLKENNLDNIDVGTIHTFQGDERDVIIFSPVYSNGSNLNSLRFINESQINILNVAITRAKSVFEIVGDKSWASTNYKTEKDLYYKLYQYIMDNQ